MKTKLLIIVMMMAVAMSCRKGSGSALQATGSESAPTNLANKNTGRPFKGSMIFQLSTTLNLPCNCGTLATVGSFTGQGNITHMGLLQSQYKTCASPIMAGTMQIGNHIVITCGKFIAANGDEINVNIAPYDLMFGNTAASGVLTAEFNGGTGRFVNATGSFTGIITVNYAQPNTAVLSNIDGSIDY